MSILEKIVLGIELPLDRQVYKYAFLRAYFFVIIFTIALFYLAFDTISEVREFIPWYIAMILISIIGISINRFGYYTWANVLLI